mgnify:CR=1 FL=1
MNDTIVKFGHPATLIAEYDHWVVLLRPAQPALGALVLAAKSDATAFGDLPAAAHAELLALAGPRRAALVGAPDRGGAVGLQRCQPLCQPDRITTVFALVWVFTVVALGLLLA